MDQQVRGERGAPLEGLAALLASERLLAGVNGPGKEKELLLVWVTLNGIFQPFLSIKEEVNTHS